MILAASVEVLNYFKFNPGAYHQNLSEKKGLKVTSMQAHLVSNFENDIN